MQCMKIFEKQKGIQTYCIQKRFIYRTFPINSVLKRVVDLKLFFLMYKDD